MKNNKLLFLFLAMAWTLLIFYGCSLPGKELPKVGLFDHFDKLVHLIFFIVFAFLWMQVLGRKRYAGLLVMICSALYGLGIEYYQMYFVEGRSFEVWDAVADALGGTSAYFFRGGKSKVIAT